MCNCDVLMSFFLIQVGDKTKHQKTMQENSNQYILLEYYGILK